VFLMEFQIRRGPSSGRDELSVPGVARVVWAVRTRRTDAQHSRCVVRSAGCEAVAGIDRVDRAVRRSVDGLGVRVASLATWGMPALSSFSGSSGICTPICLTRRAHAEFRDVRS